MHDLFLGDFLLIRTFCCGVKQEIFRRKYQSLPSKEQERLKRVAERLWMIFQLRYRLQYEQNFAWRGLDRDQLVYQEKPSLEIYLLATCVDTLAGKPEYVLFGEWLEEEQNSGKINKWFTEQQISGKMSVAEVLKLFEYYHKDYGGNKTFRDLFNNLPSVLIDWLDFYIKFEKYRDTRTLNKKLFKYISDKWRNPFTHGSIKNQAWEIGRDVELPADRNEQFKRKIKNPILKKAYQDEQWVKSFDGYLKCRLGLDMATILRVIIYVVVLTRLEFEITTNHLDTYVRALSKLDAFYKFKWAINYNRDILHSWKKYDSSPMIVYPLDSDQTQRLNNKLKISPVAMEQQLSKILTEYEDNLEIINAKVAEFNKNYPRESFEKDLDSYCQALSEFFTQQVTTNAYQAVLQISQSSRVKSIDLFIREVFLHWTIEDNIIFETTVWATGNPNQKTGSGYGINIPKKIRDTIFNPAWENIQLDLDGQLFTVPITPAFWNKCNEVRSKHIGKWLIKNNAHTWPKGSPPKLYLSQIEGNKFKATIKNIIT